MRRDSNSANDLTKYSEYLDVWPTFNHALCLLLRPRVSTFYARSQASDRRLAGELSLVDARVRKLTCLSSSQVPPNA